MITFGLVAASADRTDARDSSSQAMTIANGQSDKREGEPPRQEWSDRMMNLKAS
jgi:hypothetical protein